MAINRNSALKMGKFSSNVTLRGLYGNQSKADNVDSNAHLLLGIYKNISLVLEAIRSENNANARLRQENYAV